MKHSLPGGGQRARFDSPPVHLSKSGVHFVNPADILRSKAGQSEIRKAADAARSGAVHGKNGKK